MTTRLPARLIESCEFAENVDPLSAYPGGKFTAIANDLCYSSGGSCLRKASGNVAALYTWNTAETPPANHAAQATVADLAAGRLPRIVVRYVDANNHYFAGINTSTGLLQLFKWTGTSTLVGFYSTAATSGTILVIVQDEAGAAHTQIDVYLDGVLRIEYHDETPVGYGMQCKAGVRWGLGTVAGGTMDGLAVFALPTLNAQMLGPLAARGQTRYGLAS